LVGFVADLLYNNLSHRTYTILTCRSTTNRISGDWASSRV